MGTATVEAIVLKVPPTLLGPESPYEVGRLELKKKYDDIIVAAKKVTAINSAEALENANNLGRMLQAGTKDSEAFFKPIKQQIDAFKAPVLEHEKKFASELDEEKRRLGGLITTYNQEQERIRQEVERAAREAAEAAAREEALNRAVELDAAGDSEAAEAVLEEPIVAPVIIQQQAPQRMVGQVGKTTYSCIVTDVKALLKAVAEGKAPMDCFTLDQGYLNKKAALEKEGFILPGCKLDKQNTTHFRS